jgi:histidine ammonia-lyase
MTATMIGVGECFTPHGRVPAKVAFVSHGLETVTFGPRKVWRC